MLFLNYGFSQRAASAKGQLTMSEVALLDGTNPRVTVFYYDEKGRLVQERSENRIGGYDYIFYELDFTGLVLKQRHEHYSDYGDLFQTHYYFYDGQGRVTRIEHGLDDNAILNTETIKTIAAYTYDELGNLQTKYLYPDNSNQAVNYRVNYDYHIRGGLKRISSAYFTETLFYGNEASRNNALLSSTGYKAAYNGNIATKITEGLKRSGNNRANTYQYNYKYDQADRLTGAVYYNSNGEKFSTTGMTYDRNGNMLTLTRQGITQKLSPITSYNTGVVDDLTYVYDGNRLSQILDANSTSWPFEGIQTYLPLLNPVLENIYNSNGALVFSGDQGLSIENNLLNLPKRIEDLDNNVVEIIYDAAGQKVSYTDHSNSSQNKIYHRGMIYKNGELNYMALPEGYYDGSSYYATISDYLGSVRVVLKDNPTAFNLASEVMEINHYDPWGVEFGMSEDPFGVQDFKHQGKERMNLLGKNVHDHGARLAFDGRWGSPDPLQEILYGVSPYVYCNNNPINRIDPTGMIDEPYLVFNAQTNSLQIWDDRNTSDDFTDDLFIGEYFAHNEVASTSKGKWEDGVYEMQDKNTPNKHPNQYEKDGITPQDSPNGRYGENGIYRAREFKETTTTTTRTGMGVHAGRENQAFKSRKTMGCIRTTSEAMEAINNAIQEYGPLQSIIIQNNRTSINSQNTNSIFPGTMRDGKITLSK